MFISDQQPGSHSKPHDAIDYESEMNPYRSSVHAGISKKSNSCRNISQQKGNAGIFYMVAH